MTICCREWVIRRSNGTLGAEFSQRCPWQSKLPASAETQREGIIMWNMWGWELNSKGLALPWPSECVEKEARREQVVSWVETRAGKILHLCSTQHQSCPHASVFKSYSYAPNCLTSLSSDAVFVVQALLDCLTVHQSASIVLHCIKESTPFILGWLHSIEIPRVGLAL